MNRVLLYIGSGMIIPWGISHIIPTPGVVKGFEPLTPDNRKIITMEWVAEGLTLCFLGVLVLLTAILYGVGDAAATFVYRASAVMLFIMAAWTALTGARTSIFPIKICPVVKTTAGLLILLGTLI